MEYNASNIIVLYLENIFQSVRENIFMRLEDGSALKISYHSCGRTQFALQHPHWTAHNPPISPAPGISDVVALSVLQLIDT